MPSKLAQIQTVISTIQDAALLKKIANAAHAQALRGIIQKSQKPFDKVIDANLATQVEIEDGDLDAIKESANKSAKSSLDDMIDTLIATGTDLPKLKVLANAGDIAAFSTLEAGVIAALKDGPVFYDALSQTEKDLTDRSDAWRKAASNKLKVHALPEINKLTVDTNLAELIKLGKTEQADVGTIAADLSTAINKANIDEDVIKGLVHCDGYDEIRKEAANKVAAYLKTKLVDADTSKADDLAALVKIVNTDTYNDLSGEFDDVGKLDLPGVDADLVKALNLADLPALAELKEIAAKKVADYVLAHGEVAADDPDQAKVKQLAILAKTKRADLKGGGTAAAIAGALHDTITNDMIKALEHATDEDFGKIKKAADKKVAAYLKTKLINDNDLDTIKAFSVLATKTKADLTEDEPGNAINGRINEIDKEMIQSLASSEEYADIQKHAAAQVVDYLKGDKLTHGAREDKANLLAKLATVSTTDKKADLEAISQGIETEFTDDTVTKAMIESMQHADDIKPIKDAAEDQVVAYLTTKLVHGNDLDTVAQLVALVTESESEAKLTAAAAAIADKFADVGEDLLKDIAKSESLRKKIKPVAADQIAAYIRTQKIAAKGKNIGMLALASKEKGVIASNAQQVKGLLDKDPDKIDDVSQEMIGALGFCSDEAYNELRAVAAKEVVTSKLGDISKLNLDELQVFAEIDSAVITNCPQNIGTFIDQHLMAGFKHADNLAGLKELQKTAAKGLLLGRIAALKSDDADDVKALLALAAIGNDGDLKRELAEDANISLDMNGLGPEKARLIALFGDPDWQTAKKAAQDKAAELLLVKIKDIPISDTVANQSLADRLAQLNELLKTDGTIDTGPGLWGDDRGAEFDKLLGAPPSNEELVKALGTNTAPTGELPTKKVRAALADKALRLNLDKPEPDMDMATKMALINDFDTAINNHAGNKLELGEHLRTALKTAALMTAAVDGGDYANSIRAELAQEQLRKHVLDMGAPNPILTQLATYAIPTNEQALKDYLNTKRADLGLGGVTDGLLNQGDTLLSDDFIKDFHGICKARQQLLSDAASLGSIPDLVTPMGQLEARRPALASKRKAWKAIQEDPTSLVKLDKPDGKTRNILGTLTELKKEIETTNALIKLENIGKPPGKKVPEIKPIDADVTLAELADRIKVEAVSKLLYGDESNATTKKVVAAELNGGILTDNVIKKLNSPYTPAIIPPVVALPPPPPIPFNIKECLQEIHDKHERDPNAAALKIGDDAANAVRFRNLSLHIFGTEDFAAHLAKAHRKDLDPDKANFEAHISTLLDRGFKIEAEGAPIRRAQLNARSDTENYVAQRDAKENAYRAALDGIHGLLGDDDALKLPYSVGDTAKQEPFVQNARVNAAMRLLKRNPNYGLRDVPMGLDDDRRQERDHIFRIATETVKRDYLVYVKQRAKATEAQLSSPTYRAVGDGGGKAVNLLATVSASVGMLVLAPVSYLVATPAAKIVSGSDAAWSVAKTMNPFQWREAVTTQKKSLERTKETLEQMRDPEAAILNKVLIASEHEEIENTAKCLEVGVINLELSLKEIDKRLAELPPRAGSNDHINDELRTMLEKDQRDINARLKDLKALHSEYQSTLVAIKATNEVTAFGFEFENSQVYNADNEKDFWDDDKGFKAGLKSEFDYVSPLMVTSATNERGLIPLIVKKPKKEFIGHKFKIRVEDAKASQGQPPLSANEAKRYKHVRIHQSGDNRTFRLVSDMDQTYKADGSKAEMLQKASKQPIDKEHDACAVMVMARKALNTRTKGDLLRNPIVVSGKDNEKVAMMMASLHLAAKEMGLELTDKHIKCADKRITKSVVMGKSSHFWQTDTFSQPTSQLASKALGKTQTLNISRSTKAEKLAGKKDETQDDTAKLTLDSKEHLGKIREKVTGTTQATKPADPSQQEARSDRKGFGKG